MDITTTHHSTERTISTAERRNYTSVSMANWPYYPTSSWVGQLYESGNCQDQKCHAEASRSNTVSSANGRSKLVDVKSGFFQGGRLVAFKFSRNSVVKKRGKVAEPLRMKQCARVKQCQTDIQQCRTYIPRVNIETHRLVIILV